MQNQVIGASERLDNFYDPYADIFSDTVDYIMDILIRFKEKSLVDFNVFDARSWLDNLFGFGQ